MHTFRLLAMAEEIAIHHKVIVHREDREFLLSIRSGSFEYPKLIGMVEERMIRIEEAYAKSDLPGEPCIRKAETCWFGSGRSFIGEGSAQYFLAQFNFLR